MYTRAFRLIISCVCAKTCHTENGEPLQRHLIVGIDRRRIVPAMQQVPKALQPIVYSQGDKSHCFSMVWQSYATLPPPPLFHNKVKTSYAMFWLKKAFHTISGSNLDRACRWQKAIRTRRWLYCQSRLFLFAPRVPDPAGGEHSQRSINEICLDRWARHKKKATLVTLHSFWARASAELSSDCPIDHVRLTAERFRFFLRRRRLGSANWPGYDGFTRSCFQVLQFNKLYLSSASARGRYCPGLREVRPWGAVKNRRLVIIWTDLWLEGFSGAKDIGTMQIDCMAWRLMGCLVTLSLWYECNLLFYDNLGCC